MTQVSTEMPEFAAPADVLPAAEPSARTIAAPDAGDDRAAAEAVAARPSSVSIVLQLTKFRLSLLVVWTTAVGAILATETPGASFDAVRFAWTLLGTTLAAGSANALNQVLEIARDARMHRTRTRPLPARAIAPAPAAAIGLGLGALGCGMLAVFVNLPAACLALLTIALYVGVYTPMKPRTTLNTLVGAVVGAIPPMIGWTSVTGGFEAGGWALAAILFTWQLPHFLALAWLYRADYARGGFRMLPVVDPDGRLTAQVAVTTSMMLVPVALVPALLGLAGWFHVVGAIALGGWMTVRALRFQQARDDDSAKRLFLASLVYLTALLVLVVVDRTAVGRPFEVPVQRTAPTAAVATLD